MALLSFCHRHARPTRTHARVDLLQICFVLRLLRCLRLLQWRPPVVEAGLTPANVGVLLAAVMVPGDVCRGDGAAGG